MKRLILYGRVSTDEQADNYSLPTQLEACRKYAQDNGFEVVAEFAEDYTGTVPIEARPEGSKAYRMLSEGEADALIAYRIDRIVRPPEEGDEWDMPVLIRGLAKLGKELHTCDRGRLGTSFADLLIAMLDAKSAGDERRKFIERSRRGKRQKARAGKPYSGGHVPYGYRVAPDEKTGKGAYFEIDESEAKVVRLIYQWYTQGNGDGQPMGLHPIAHKLREMGIPTPGESLRCYNGVRKAASCEWGDYIISRILDREAYTGIYHYNDDNIPVEIPAIVSRDLFKRAQAQREYNKRMAPRNNTKRRYLLRGMIKCGCGCGMTMIGMVSGNRKNLYYASRPRIAKGRCKRRNLPYGQTQIRADVIEHAAWEYLLSTMTNAGEFEARLREAQVLEERDKEPKRERLELVLEMIAEAEKEASSIAQELRRRPDGIVRSSLERQEAEVNARYEKLHKERQKLQKELETQTVTDQQIEDALSFQRAVKAGLQNPTWEDKRYYLEQMGFEAVIIDMEAHFSCYLDLEGITFDLQTRIYARAHLRRRCACHVGSSYGRAIGQ